MRRGNPLPRGVVLDGSTFGGHGRGHVGRGTVAGWALSGSTARRRRGGLG